MTHDTTHNGWSNYATWRINLELCSDRIEMLQEDISGGYLDPFDTIDDLASYLEQDVDDTITDYGQNDGYAVSLAQSFVSDVNFYEIAEAAVADNPELIVRDDVCSECGADLDDGEGYDGLCGTCADKAEATT